MVPKAEVDFISWLGGVKEDMPYETITNNKTNMLVRREIQTEAYIYSKESENIGKVLW